MKAVIVTGGKQYTVAEGDVLFVEKLNVEADAAVKFDQVLAVLDGENTKIGAPVVEGATVEAKVVKNGKGKKIDIIRYKAKKGEKREIDVTVMSFGYKHGLPMEADLVFDVRFLPNPFYVEELRPLCGLDRPVAEFVFGYQQTRTFMEKIQDMLDFLLPLYIEEGKLALTVAIGCTGGRHRSVAIASAVTDYLLAEGISAVNVNRDLDK